MIRNNVAFAHYASGKGTYGGGVVISDSSNTCAEGNVIIGGDGGLSLLQGIRGDEHKDKWFCKDNIFRDNLIVSPRTFVIWVRNHLQFQPTEEKNNNRFIRNVVIKGGYGTGFINWGENEYADIIELDQAVPQVEGSQQYESLGQVKSDDKGRLDKALGRVLEAIGRIEPRLRFLSRESVSLEDIWSFGKGRGEILGFWVRYKDGRVLLLDAEKEGLIELLVGTGDKMKGVELWDFGREQALKGLHPVNLVSKDGMIKGEIRGSFGLICGLPVSTKPLEIIRGWAEVEGKEVRNLVEGQTFDIALELSNPWDEEVRYNLKGPGIKDNAISIRTGEKKKISLRETASTSKISFSYQISSDRLPEKEFEISLRIDKPVEIPCPKIEADGDSKKYIFSALFKIDKKGQYV